MVNKSSDHIVVDAHWAFQRYEEIRERLPIATAFPGNSTAVANLGELANAFDVFLFDSFGVLNVGTDPIAGAAARIEMLRRSSKQVMVLTNAASVPLPGLPAKYAAFGFDFQGSEIVSSRAVTLSAMMDLDRSARWLVIAPTSADVSDIPGVAGFFDPAQADDVDGFILLSSHAWTATVEDALKVRLRARPRPVLVANPDLVAPYEDGLLRRQPGAIAHDLMDALGAEASFFGKPYANAFDMAMDNVIGDVDPARVLMIGDTLHTDILGGAAAGIKTALVTAHGVMKDMDVNACIAESGIVPDYVLPSI